MTLTSLHIPTAPSLLKKSQSSWVKALHVTGLLTIISSLDDLGLVQRLLPRSCHAQCLLVHNLKMLSLTPSAGLALRYTLQNCVTSTVLPYPALFSAPIPAANLVQPRWFLIFFVKTRTNLKTSHCALQHLFTHCVLETCSPISAESTLESPVVTDDSCKHNTHFPHCSNTQQACVSIRQTVRFEHSPHTMPSYRSTISTATAHSMPRLHHIRRKKKNSSTHQL